MARTRKTFAAAEMRDARVAVGSGVEDGAATNGPVRRAAERGSWMERIRGAPAEGERSGEPGRFDFAAFKTCKAAQHRRAPSRSVGDP